MARDHERYSEDLAPYVLGALSTLEAEALEKHLRSCGDCRSELVELRAGADALARSVDHLEPSAGLRAKVLEAMSREVGAGGTAAEDTPAREAEGSPTARGASARRRLDGLRPTRSGRSMLPRPALAVAMLAVAVVAGVGGWAIGTAGTNSARIVERTEDDRTMTASIDRGRLPDARGKLTVEPEGSDAVLRLSGLRNLGPKRTYEVWVQREGELAPGPLFSPTADGAAVTGIPGRAAGIEGVYVTRERAGGARTPTETPIVSVPISQ